MAIVSVVPGTAQPGGPPLLELDVDEVPELELVEPELVELELEPLLPVLEPDEELVLDVDAWPSSSRSERLPQATTAPTERTTRAATVRSARDTRRSVPPGVAARNGSRRSR